MSKTIFLVAADTRREGTAAVTTYSGLFIRSGDPAGGKLLHGTEKFVCDCLSEGESCITCGCVTGCTESVYSAEDRRMLERNGLNRRFEF